MNLTEPKVQVWKKGWQVVTLVLEPADVAVAVETVDHDEVVIDTLVLDNRSTTLCPSRRTFTNSLQ